MNIRQIHRNSLLKNLAHRLEVAKLSGNNALIEQLEAEKRHYSQ